MSYLHEHLKAIGDFPGVIQIAASAPLHELLTDPARGNADASAAPLTYHGGKLINNGQGKFYNIYLGSQDFDTADFNVFTQAICENGYYLSPDGKDATPCKFMGSMTVPNDPFPSTVTDGAIGSWLGPYLLNHGLHADGFTQFSLIFPAGTTVTLGSSSSCTAFCGYHTRTPGGIYYQVICDSNCSGCHGSFPVNQSRMMIQAHELGEWRSDPDGNGWYNDQTGMENGDECAWQLIPWGPAGKGWAVQPLAVNGTCHTGPYVPPGPPPPPPPPPPVLKGSIVLTEANGTVRRFTEA